MPGNDATGHLYVRTEPLNTQGGGWTDAAWGIGTRRHRKM